MESSGQKLQNYNSPFSHTHTHTHTHTRARARILAHILEAALPSLKHFGRRIGQSQFLVFPSPGSLVFLPATLPLPPPPPLQTGAWGCFDEFNRINVEVLSVVAQQILSILSALAAGLTRFYFEGFEINLVWSCGIFITMNPGKGLGVE